MIPGHNDKRLQAYDRPQSYGHTNNETATDTRVQTHSYEHIATDIQLDTDSDTDTNTQLQTHSHRHAATDMRLVLQTQLQTLSYRHTDTEKRIQVQQQMNSFRHSNRSRHGVSTRLRVDTGT